MNETMDYIFEKLRASEVVMQKVAKELKRQKRFNRRAVVITGVAVYFTIAVGIEQRKQAKKIEKLEKEIEELKRPEGE